MRALLLILALASPQFIFVVPSGTTINAASCNRDDVQTAVTKAVTGNIVAIPSGTCTWTSGMAITKAITLRGAGAGATVLQLNIGSSMFDVDLASATETFRLSAMSIIPTGSGGGMYAIGTFNGTCNSSTCSHIRIDHITSSGWVNGTNFSGFLLSADNVFGVIDHLDVTVTTGAILINIGQSSYGGVGLYGDNSWAQADSFGTDNALYLEANTFTGLSANGFAITDTTALGGGRFVVRFNDLNNASIQTHGTESSGRLRGFRHLEAYHNDLFVTGGWNGDLIGWRGGTGLTFNNTLVRDTPSESLNSEASMTAYRVGTYFSPWGYCGSDLAVWDNQDGVDYVTGTVTSTSLVGNTLVVTDTTKSTLAMYDNPANTYFVVNTTLTNHPAGEISDATSNSVTATSYGIFNGSAPAWNIGDSYKILRSAQCLDQPGNGPGIYLSGYDPTFTDWVEQPIHPVYQWGSTYSVAAAPPFGWLARSAGLLKIVENVHFYQQAASFNGTVGTGSGVIASRPATCTTGPSGVTGVAYWATNEGEWNSTNGATADGRLYVCSATNTWTLHYTPYTYPHPLNN